MLYFTMTTFKNAIYCSGEMKEVFGHDPLSSHPIGRNREWLSTFLTILVEEEYNGSCHKVGYAIVHKYEKPCK